MSLFDNIQRVAKNGGSIPQSADKQSVTFSFASLPENLAQLQALPEATLTTPFQAAALTVCALCVYGADREKGKEMLNFLKGPKPLSNYEISFLNDRFRDGTYVPFSYFQGAVPENDYTPSLPFAITVTAGPYADANPGYKKLHIASGGADNPREIVLRQKGDGQWLLWEQFLMVGIRQPKSADPWA